MNRLSDKYKILFIEEPGDDIGNSLFTYQKVNANLSVLTPHMEWTNWKTMCKSYINILQNDVKHLDQSVFWFYSPFYVHVLSSLTPSVIVYDCMDELSAFKNASPNLPAYERQLMRHADVVFTGGKSLYEGKKSLHDKVYCFPSSVDYDHFKKSNKTIPPELAHLSGPIVGFYGVLDERLDFNLLGHVANELQDINFILVGPLAKIQEEDLCKSHNIHYLGKRDYNALPDYLECFDVAIMPFAINEATRFISPTKTLEFMAAGKPIVSTPIHDVVRDYSDVIAIAESPQTFAAHINRFLKESAEAKKQRQYRYNHILAKTSWSTTVNSMDTIIIDEKQRLKQGMKKQA